MILDYIRLMRLDKPIGIFLLLWPTLWALFIASKGIPKYEYLVVFSLGVFLTRSAGCIFNDLADIKFDKFVNRTKLRPLANNKINPKHAIILGIIISLMAFVLSVVFLSTQVVILSILAAVIYVSYPWFKRFFPIPQIYLGIAYSFGILIAFIQVTKTVSITCLLMYFANLFWVIVYDTEYALVDLEDDLKIKIKTAAITFGDSVGFILSICSLLFILLMLIVGVLSKLNFYYYLSLFFIIFLLIIQIKVVVQKQKNRYFKMFLLNNWVGLIIFLGIVCSYL